MAITFKQFIELTERYYEPHEKLPSGKTPYDKSVDSYEKQKKAYYDKPSDKRSLPHARRLAQQATNINQHVSYGADHKNFKDYKDTDGNVHVSAGKHHLTVQHPESGLEYNISHHSRYGSSDEKGRPIHNVTLSHKGEFSNTHHSKSTTPKERRELAKKAAHIWQHHVVPRIPTGTRLQNHPSDNDHWNRETGEYKEKNARAKIYKRHGFSDRDDYGNQHAEVTRPPSSKRAAKGAKRLRPIDPPTNQDDD